MEAHATNGDTVPGLPELLFHTTLTVIDYHTDTSGSTRTVYPLGTHITLEAARTFASRALQQLNYQPDDFEEYKIWTPDASWTHGDGVVVYARDFGGQEFLVGLDTKTNTESLPGGGPGDTLLLPGDTECLHYVMQSKIDYNQDRSGAFQNTEIQGCHLSRADAVEAAKRALDMAPNEFAQYDERREDDSEGEGGWPFGENVIIHAVAQTGENYNVAVRTVPESLKLHSKKL